MTCATAAGLVVWISQNVQPAAERLFGSPVRTVEQLGTYNCRQLYGAPAGRWSEHATGNAIDISAFQLEDGRRISLLEGWEEEGSEARFLHVVRDAACLSFGTVLSPDYNAAHADHLHLDQGRSAAFSTCR
ncbi:extensin family protein [Aurantiacibacter spongiae]|uniref:extensin family protein n=1 Tax=Aurantiacibacter spongiae TaxID=2488860 RepID=UPI001F37830D|nr:extensin family protein [Aurantiacibacter spongiae]